MGGTSNVKSAIGLISNSCFFFVLSLKKLCLQAWHTLLQQTPMSHVAQYLTEHNLLNVQHGPKAPNG